MTSWLRVSLLRLTALFRKGRLEQELDEELRSHLELLVEENQRMGMSPEEARYAALRSFGGVAQVKEAYREQGGLPIMETLVQDLRYGARTLRKSPGFTAVAVLTLALGIGANTAIFSMLDAVLLRMLPVEDPERLVVVGFTSPEWPNAPGTAFSYPMYQDLRDRSQVFSGMLAYASVPLSANSGDRTERVSGQLVSGNFFSVLGVKPLLGRSLSDEDNKTPGAHPVAVLSYNYWKNRLAGDRNLVGKTFDLNSYPFTVVGVAPPDFFGVEVGIAPDIWLPMMMQAQLMPQTELMPGFSLLSDSGTRWLRIIARLNPGTNEPQARVATDVLFQQMSRVHLDLFFHQWMDRLQRMNREQLQKLPFVPSREILERVTQE